MYNFELLPLLVDRRYKLPSHAWKEYKDYGIGSKRDQAIHHSLTKEGSAEAFARYHVRTHGWPGIAYHFVILKDGTIIWCHNPGVLSYHVGNSNKQAIGICLVGDFRSEEPTDEQKKSLYDLHYALKKDMPNYRRTKGHNEFPGYAWKACPEFDYEAVIRGEFMEKKYNTNQILYLAKLLHEKGTSSGSGKWALKQLQKELK
ncbi:peptidoglycan recognition family protein [Bacillus tianshenii]|nr:peptidoglycan recognition family protein [Bacillus tianshenii]